MSDEVRSLIVETLLVKMESADTDLLATGLLDSLQLIELLTQRDQASPHLLRSSGIGGGHRPVQVGGVSAPRNAKAVAGVRRVAWVFSKQFGLFELIERNSEERA